MFLHRSNRSELLVDELATTLTQRRLSDPFAPELIAVQSKGMERWLSLELSARLPVCANLELPFPRHLLVRMFDAVLGEARAASAAYQEHSLLWAIAALLPTLSADPALAPIARYLADDTDGNLRFQLAERIASVFDDYGVYRPSLLLQWEQGTEGGWEAVLWRALLRAHGPNHPARRARQFLTELQQQAPAAGTLPERLCVFGISSLPPVYLDVLEALSKHIETHLFLLSPSNEYFADQKKRRHELGEPSPDGHPLVASLGKLGAEMQDLLAEREHQEGARELYLEPGESCLLHALQSDILALRNRGVQGASKPRYAIEADDDSIAIGVCHGAMREIEVLHDRLTDLLQDETLEPHQIVVMAPDIETYAPAIEAVFGAHSGRPAIPFSVADRRTRATHDVIDALYAVIETLEGRLPAGMVLDLLGLDCIRERFAITTEELDRVREWVEDSGIRWGADAEHRAQAGQPGFAHNTWRFGLDRLLLGFAMGDQDGPLYANTLPLGGIDGSEGELLGKLWSLCDRLFAHREVFTGARTLAQWSHDISALLRDFVVDAPATAKERELVRSAILELQAGAEGVGFSDPVPLRALMGQLEQRLDAGLPARGLLARGVTFCQLVPMRSIPFAVVCLIGMNDDAFPKPSAPLSFDRMAEHGAHEKGDRNSRDDDRYMFLEALLCARKQLYLSYVGRGIHDDRVRPPSVVVSELLDAIAQSCRPTGLNDSASLVERRKAIEERLCIVQRLHAFSLQYFNGSDPRLFSYATHACDAARSLLRERRDPIARGPSPIETETLRELSVDDFVRIIAKPIAMFAQRRLGLFLGDDLEPLKAREPVEPAQLDRWKLRDSLIRAALDRQPFEQVLPRVRAAGLLPLGAAGQVAFDELRTTVEPLAVLAIAQRGERKLAPLPIALMIDGVEITGVLDQLWSSAHTLVSASNLGKRFELEHFLRHVVLCCQLEHSKRSDYPRQSLVFANDGGVAKTVRFAPLQEPQRVLSSLLELCRYALRAALPFEHNAAREYEEAVRTPTKKVPLEAAAKRYDDDHGYPDKYARFFYPSFADLLAAKDVPSFDQICTTIFEPFYACRSVT